MSSKIFEFPFSLWVTLVPPLLGWSPLVIGWVKSALVAGALEVGGRIDTKMGIIHHLSNQFETFKT